MLDREALAGQPLHAAVGTLFGINRPPVALAGETCRIVATRLAVHGIERLPVVASAEAPRLLGIVSRSDLIKATAGLHAEEHERRALRRNPLVKRRAEET
jgi:CBS domain-containing protein